MQTPTLAPENFSSPALQALEEVWDDYEAEQAEEDEIRKVIARIESFVNEKILEMEKDADSAEVDILDPNRVAILGAFQDHLTALNVMRQALGEADYDSIDHSFEILQSATNRMVQGLAGIVEDSERYSRIRCVRCSTENKCGASFCSQCAAILPKVEQENVTRLIATEGDKESSDETTPDYIEVAEAHEGWAEGQLTAEEFYQVLQQVRERQVDHYEEVDNELRELSGTPEESAYCEVLQTFLSAIEQAALALDRMLSGLEQGQAESVESGLDDLAEATIRLVELDRQHGQDTETLQAAAV